MSNEYDRPEMGNEDYELQAILAEYRKKRLIDMLIGPVVSLVFHMCLLVMLGVFFAGSVVEVPDEFEAITETIEEKELDKEIEDIEEQDLEVPEDNTAMVDLVVEDIPNLEPTNDPTVDNTPMDLMDMNVEDIPEIKMNQSPLILPSLFGARAGIAKTQALNKFAGAHAAMTQKAVSSTLSWLKDNQHELGYWPKDENPDHPRGYAHSMTGLALLCYLANGSLIDDENFGLTVEKAINWLIKNIDQETGLISIGVKRSAHATYANAIVCYAISEAYGMTKMGQLRPIMDAMVKRIIAAQRKDNTWAYNYALDGGHSDSSLAGWHAQALKAAVVSGCRVEGLQKALDRSADMFMKAILDDGTAYYDTDKKRQNKVSLGAVSALCLQLMGDGKHEKVGKAFDRIKKEFDVKGDANMFTWNNKVSKGRQGDANVLVYDWYYQTQVVFQRQDMAFWAKWNRGFLVNQVLKNQIRSKNAQGVEVGYWDWPGGSKVNGWKQLYSTTLMCLSLEVYFRNLPTFKGASVNEKSKEEQLFGGDDDIL